MKSSLLYTQFLCLITYAWGSNLYLQDVDGSMKLCDYFFYNCQQCTDADGCTYCKVPSALINFKPSDSLKYECGIADNDAANP